MRKILFNFFILSKQIILSYSYNYIYIYFFCNFKNWHASERWERCPILLFAINIR